MIRNLDNETITVTLKEYVWRQLRDSYQGKIWQKEKLANNGGDRWAVEMENIRGFEQVMMCRTNGYGFHLTEQKWVSM